MNERAKKIFMCLGSFFVGIFAFICRTILQSKRNTTDENRARVEELKRRAEQQQSNNRSAVTRIDEASEIIREIRAKQQILEDDDCLDKWYCNSIIGDNDLGAE